MGLVDDTTDVTTLDELPGLGGLLVEAARGVVPGLDDLVGREPADTHDSEGPSRPSGTTRVDVDLPHREVRVRGVEVNVADVAAYARVCGFRLDTRVPVTWPHVVGFPVGMWLMTREDFPHAVVGLVHVRNRIHAHDHVRVGDVVDVAATVADQRPHARGVQFDVRVEVSRDDDVVWESTSTYLRRDPSAAAGDVPDEGGPDVDAAELPLTGQWSLGSDLGRRYAAVSGDRNPIHLSAVTARAFGFRRAIAHGMWTKAAALAGLGRLPRPVDIDVVFHKPVELPSTVTYATRRDDAGQPGNGAPDPRPAAAWQFALRRDDGAPHLVGTATFA